MMRTDPFRELDRATDAWFGRASAPWLPMDALRRGDSVTVYLDMPGVDSDSIDLTVERNELKVEAERFAPSDQDSQFIVRERPTGRYTRRLYLGENLDTDALQAEYTQGVLVLTIPMRESAKPRKVEIRSTDTQKAVASGN